MYKNKKIFIFSKKEQVTQSPDRKIQLLDMFCLLLMQKIITVNSFFSDMHNNVSQFFCPGASSLKVKKKSKTVEVYETEENSPSKQITPSFDKSLIIVFQGLICT